MPSNQRSILLTLLVLSSIACSAQSGRYSISGFVLDSLSKSPMVGATVETSPTGTMVSTDQNGAFLLSNLAPGPHELTVSFLGKQPKVKSVEIHTQTVEVQIYLVDEANVLNQVTVSDNRTSATGINRLRQVEGFAIYASKKNELVELSKMTINKAANRSRQVYAKVSGLNIWESDGAGVQLGIGGRGLSPSRNSNFNTRQNGYDISADALGYPESYYTPPIEAIDRIEIIRGAASLQYGTQFGGMLNFKFKEGPADKKAALTSRQTIGSFGFLNSFNSIGGEVGRAKYYGFYQYKKSDGWRPNESIDQHTAYLGTTISLSNKIKVRPEYTHTNYIAQQPGGLTDAQFEADPRQSNRARNWFSVDWNLLALNIDIDLTANLRLNSRSFGLIGGRDALGNLDPINLLDFGENRDMLRDQFNNFGNETRMLLRYNTASLPSTFLIGTRYYIGRTERQQGDGDAGIDAKFEYLNPSNLEGSDFTLPSRNFSLFAENIFSLSQKWTLTPGLRFEYIKTSSEGYFRVINKDLAGNVILDERVNESKNSKRSFLFFGIGSSFRPTDNLELYGNFSQNYRAINFNDIRVNVGSLIVDENLTDERGYNIDVGLRGKWRNFFDYDISLYHLAYNDRIGTILKKEPNPVFNNLVDRIIRFRTNIADADIYGIESLFEFNLRNWLAPSADGDLALFTNISVTDAKYQASDIPDQEGKEVELVPPFIFKLGLYGRWKNLGFNFQFGHTAEHYSDASNAVFTPTAIEGIIPSYDIVDLSLKYQWKKFIIEGSINNLLDASYFTRRATGYPGPGIIPSQGRSFYLTLGINL